MGQTSTSVGETATQRDVDCRSATGRRNAAANGMRIARGAGGVPPSAASSCFAQTRRKFESGRIKSMGKRWSHEEHQGPINEK